VKSHPGDSRAKPIGYFRNETLPYTNSVAQALVVTIMFFGNRPSPGPWCAFHRRIRNQPTIPGLSDRFAKLLARREGWCHQRVRIRVSIQLLGANKRNIAVGEKVSFNMLMSDPDTRWRRVDLNHRPLVQDHSSEKSKLLNWPFPKTENRLSYFSKTFFTCPIFF